jgi:hypothetical protein
MTFEEALDMYAMYCVSPQSTCQCDEELQVLCQQCLEDECNLNGFENQTLC